MSETGRNGAPIDAVAFDRMMAAFAPFETHPRIALAVSGGADSMALAALGLSWARARGGAPCAFVVDHGLRSESSGEAAMVAGRCRAMGLETEILAWEGPKPGRGIQAAARRARYDLLAAACARAGILHLLVAHHLDDQAETVALRAERASAPGGLAGMTAVAEWRNMRLLRPLLGVAKARLVATAKAHGLAWVEDPSNLDPAFARARLRRSGGALPSLGDMRARQERRMGAEARAARDLADCVAIHPAGYARLDHESWRKLPSERRSFVAARLAMTVGGLAYPPRQDRLSRFVARFGGADTAGSATLGRCLWRRAGQDVLVARESRHLPAALDVEPGTCTRWDGRFLVKSSNPDVRVAALGAGGWRHLRELGVDGALPEAAAVALPAFHDLEGLVAVPHLQWQRRDAAACRFSAGFAPHHALGPAGFAAFVDCDPASGGGAY